MTRFRIIANDFHVEIKVDSDFHDERGEWSVTDDPQNVTELITNLVAMGVDDKGIPMNEEFASVNGIKRSMELVGYMVELDSAQMIRTDLDTVPESEMKESDKPY